MYLIIDETGEYFTCTSITQALLDEADRGIINIIIISGNQPVQWRKDGWYGINSYDQGDEV